MTEKLYYNDAYLKEFTARVISCDVSGDLYDAVLDKTAFFPEEGGQYSDRGTLGSAKVVNVKEKDGIIHHYADSALDVGAEVVGKIDFDERYEKMQCHTGEHILSGIIHSLYGLDNVGFHLGADEVTMDVSAPLTREQLDEVERLANEVIYKNVEVVASFPTQAELSAMEYRSKLDLYENVRIVKIGDYDSCACCAPHVKYTGEIGVIKILDSAKLRGGIRLFITAGRRAVRVFGEYYKTLQSASALLSLPKFEIVGGINKLLLDFSDFPTNPIIAKNALGTKSSNKCKVGLTLITQKAMARSTSKNSASSQFFIMHEDDTGLDGQYAAFGIVTEGMDIVDAICEAAESIDSNAMIAAKDQPVITSINIRTVANKTTDTADTTDATR